MTDYLIMSIKTVYAKAIFKGTKKYEYRRSSIGEKNINKKIFIYSAGVQKAVIGYIIVDKILEGNYEYISSKTNNKDKDVYEYFKSAKNCYALHVNEYKLFDKPITLKELRKIDRFINLPQYYKYLNKKSAIYKALKINNYI